MSLGIGINKEFIRNDTIFIPEFSMAVSRDVINQGDKLTTKIAGFSPKNIQAISPHPTAFTFKGSLDVISKDFYEIGVNYFYTIRHNYRGNTGSIKIKVNL